LTLKAEPGGSILVFGGPSFAHSLICHSLVAEAGPSTRSLSAREAR
jgi:hypothetical protein